MSNASLATIQPRPRETTLKQYLERHGHDTDSYGAFYNPSELYRWLVRIDCGCVTEVLTRGNAIPPTEQTLEHSLGGDEEPIYKRTWLLTPFGIQCALSREKLCPGEYCYPKGHLWHAHGEDVPMRGITEWLLREKVCHSSSGKPFTPWLVRLSCGHCGHANSDPEWSPGIPHVTNYDVVKALREEVLSRDDLSERMRRFHEEQIEFEGFLVCDPAKAARCARCVFMRRITEYGEIGKLADSWPKPEPKPTPPKPTSREAAAKQLQAVEREIHRLQKKAETLREGSAPDSQDDVPAKPNQAD